MPVYSEVQLESMELISRRVWIGLQSEDAVQYTVS